MKKEYSGKFGNFVHEERKKEEETLEICEDILKNSRNEMAVAMRFLQSAFGALRPTVSGETDVMGTDGKLLFFADMAFEYIYAKQSMDQSYVSA